MIKHSLNESGIFYVILSGVVTAADIITYLHEFEKIDYLPPNIRLLYDLRNASINLKLRDIVAISKFSKKVTSAYQSVRTAFLVSKPNVTAYSILFSRESKSKKTSRKVFSTENAAIQWLNSK